jgi:hypothetical protein
MSVNKVHTWSLQAWLGVLLPGEAQVREVRCLHHRDDGQTDREATHRAERAWRALQFGYWKQSIDELKERWTASARAAFRAIAEEEMKINREEFDQAWLGLLLPDEAQVCEVRCLHHRDDGQTVRAIAEEEMKINREEFDRQIVSRADSAQ